MAKYSIKDKTVWVTGASSGIGLELVKQVLNAGANVYATARRTTALTNLNHPNLTVDSVDVSDRDQVQKFVKKINQLDLVVLNAGQCIYLDMPDFDPIILKQNMDVNFFGLAYCIEAALPLLRQSEHPYLVGMSSSAAYVGFPRAEGYGSSKAASRYLLQCLQAHLFKDKIPVTIISPGFVKTPLTDKNDFSMPWLVPVDKAASIILQGIRKQKPEIRFPFQLIWLFRFLEALPDSLRIRLLSKKVSPQ